MQYQGCTIATQAAATESDCETARALRLIRANINPATRLATDYLNHFNEAIMLLEMVASCPDCLDDFKSWRPMTYREHFLASGFKARDLAIAAYEDAPPNARARLDSLADTMTIVIQATREAMSGDIPADGVGPMVERAVEWLNLLVARAGAVINGDPDSGLPEVPQMTVDDLMWRSA